MQMDLEDVARARGGEVPPGFCGVVVDAARYTCSDFPHCRDCEAYYEDEEDATKHGTQHWTKQDP